ncbi:hypothetical protein NX059_005401 [Plenodomus lindquistii]|nr:hypothetical protein NX059_005401 [Plenodomus lindquistii]
MASINNIPTEIDTLIAHELQDGPNRSSLSALALASNNYRVVAEPYLYQNIELCLSKPAAWTRLFKTILDHPKLAEHIKTVRLVSDRAPSNPEELFREEVAYQAMNLEAYRVRIGNAIDTVLAKMEPDSLKKLTFMQYGPEEDWQEASASTEKDYWLRHIMTMYLNPFDATLALIFCMAPNLSSIWIEDPITGTDFIRTLMRAQWKTSANAPFAKIKTTRFSNPRSVSGPIPLLQTTRSMHIDNTSPSINVGPSSTTLTTPLPLPLVPKLDSLSLFLLSLITPSDIAQLTSTPWFANLKTLQVIGGAPLDNDASVFELIDTLSFFAPTLTHLTMSQWTMYDGIGLLPDAHFRDLTCLKTLFVDFDLLVAHGDCDLRTLHIPSHVFPASLETLAVGCISTTTISQIIAAFKARFSTATDFDTAVDEALALVARSVTFKELYISLYSTWAEDISEFSVEDVRFLRRAADVLVEKGVALEVCVGYGFEGYEMLLKAGFTAPVLLEKAVP